MAKKITKSIDIYAKLHEFLNTGLKYYLECEYDTEYGNGGYYSSCTCESYCRCGRLVNIVVTEIRYDDIINNIFKIIKKSNHLIIKDIDEYCIDRIFVHHGGLDINNYEIGARSGYYGEELGEGRFINDADFISSVKRFLNLNIADCEKIKHVLDIEYGYILPSIKYLNNAEIIELDPKDIRIGSDTHYTKIASDKTILDYYKGRTLPICVIVDDTIDKYRIIDGYHRLRSNIENQSITAVRLF